MAIAAILGGEATMCAALSSNLESVPVPIGAEQDDALTAFIVEAGRLFNPVNYINVMIDEPETFQIGWTSTLPRAGRTWRMLLMGSLDSKKFENPLQFGRPRGRGEEHPRLQQRRRSCRRESLRQDREGARLPRPVFGAVHGEAGPARVPRVMSSGSGKRLGPRRPARSARTRDPRGGAMSTEYSTACGTSSTGGLGRPPRPAPQLSTLER